MGSRLEQLQQIAERFSSQFDAIPSPCVKFSIAFTHDAEAVQPHMLRKAYLVYQIDRLANQIASNYGQTTATTVLQPRDPHFDHLFSQTLKQRLPQPEALWIICKGARIGHVIGAIPQPDNEYWDIVDTGTPTEEIDIETLSPRQIRNRICSYQGVGLSLRLIRFYANHESY